MFSGARNFNSDIGDWDVSSGTNFASMFYSAQSFNRDLRPWDVASGQNLQYMFAGARVFDQDLSCWNRHPSGAGGYDNMFYLAEAIINNQDIPFYPGQSLHPSFGFRV